jgi:hypothetical protein
MKQQIVEVMSCYAYESIEHVHTMLVSTFVDAAPAALNFSNKAFGSSTFLFKSKHNCAHFPLVTDMVDIESMVPRRVTVDVDVIDTSSLPTCAVWPSTSSFFGLPCWSYPWASSCWRHLHRTHPKYGLTWDK